MSYYYQRIIPNEVIHEIEKLILEGKTYREIKEIHKVSDGTITRIKQGKVTSNREIEDKIDLVPIDEVSEIKRQLQEARKSLLESHKLNDEYRLEIERMKNAGTTKRNLVDELNSLEFSKNNVNVFFKTEFGSSLLNEFHKSEKQSLQKQKEELEANFKALEDVESDFNGSMNSFGSLN